MIMRGIWIQEIHGIFIYQQRQAVDVLELSSPLFRVHHTLNGIERSIADVSSLENAYCLAESYYVRWRNVNQDLITK
jgi:hypothetical protein